MKLFRRDDVARRADHARAEADLAEAKARMAQAKIAEEEANARQAAIREKAEAAARRRELQRQIELAPLEAEARRAEEIRLAAEHSHAQAKRSLAEATAGEEAKNRRREANAVRARHFVTAAFVGSTLVAMGGQVVAYHEGLGWLLIFSVAVAVVIESLSLAMQHQANQAYLEGDAAGSLQAGSYLLACYVAVLNYSHWSDGWAPTEEAALFAFCSLISPWLWAAHAKSEHRAQLRAAGRARPRAPRFGLLRWLLWRGETFAALSWAVRNSESDPNAAVIGLRLERLAETADGLLTDTHTILSDARLSLADARVSLADAAWAYFSLAQANAGESSARGGESSPRGAKGEQGSCESGDDDDPGLEPLPALPAPEELAAMSGAERLTRARITVKLARQAGIELEGRGAELARAYGRSDKWGQLRIREDMPPMFAIPASVDDEDDDRQEHAL